MDFALLLYDEFSGKSITGAGSVFQIGQRHVDAYVKKDGFYVFSKINQDEFELEIHRPHYLSHREQIVISKLDPKHPVVRSRLFRKDNRNFLDCQWFYSKTIPETDVLIFAEDENIKATVLEAAAEEKVSRLTILSRPAYSLLGRRFSFNPGKGKGETFLITQSQGPGVYLADRLLNHDNLKSVYPVYLSKSLADGKVSIPCECPEKITKMAYYKKGRRSGKWVSVFAAGRS